MASKGVDAASRPTAAEVAAVERGRAMARAVQLMARPFSAAPLLWVPSALRDWETLAPFINTMRRIGTTADESVAGVREFLITGDRMKLKNISFGGALKRLAGADRHLGQLSIAGFAAANLSNDVRPDLMTRSWANEQIAGLARSRKHPILDALLIEHRSMIVRRGPLKGTIQATEAALFEGANTYFAHRMNEVFPSKRDSPLRYSRDVSGSFALGIASATIRQTLSDGFVATRPAVRFMVDAFVDEVGKRLPSTASPLTLVRLLMTARSDQLHAAVGLLDDTMPAVLASLEAFNPAAFQLGTAVAEVGYQAMVSREGEAFARARTAFDQCETPTGLTQKTQKAIARLRTCDPAEPFIQRPAALSVTETIL